MATPRQFGQELNQNARRGPNLTTAQRDQICGMLNAGATVKECADAYSCTGRCIRDLYKKYYQTGTTEDKPRSGRLPILSLHQKKIIYRKARATLKIEYLELAKASVVVNHEGNPLKPLSRSILYRTLKGRGLTNFRCKKRPLLNSSYASKRLYFSRQ
jgi:transposase